MQFAQSVTMSVLLIFTRLIKILFHFVFGQFEQIGRKNLLLDTFVTLSMLFFLFAS